MDISAFLTAPSLGSLKTLKKEQLLNVAEHYGFDIQKGIKSTVKVNYGAIGGKGNHFF